MALSAVSEASTPVQSISVGVKNNNKVAFRAGVNKLEKSPKRDSIELSDNTKQILKDVGIGTGIVAGVAIAGDAIFAKGKHIKKICKTLKEKAESFAENMGGADPYYEGGLNSAPYDPLTNPLGTMNYGGYESGLNNLGYGMSGFGGTHFGSGGFGSGYGAGGFGSGYGAGGYGGYGGFGF